MNFTVVSHMHADHFNGLYKLSQKVGLGRVFLPYISDDRDLQALILGGAILSNNVGDFAKIRDDEMLQVYKFAYRNLYGEYGATFNTENESNGNIRELYRLRRERSRNSYYDYVSARPQDLVRGEWNFLLINKSIKQKKLDAFERTLRDELTDLGIARDGLFDYIVQNDDGFARLSAIYKKVFKRGTALNNTSITLLHYPKDYKRVDYEWNCDIFGCSESAATLLTGDGSMDKTLYRQIKSEIGERKLAVLQVPHHGSRYNWRALKRNWIDSETFVISFGLGNSYSHPSGEVIDDLYVGKRNFALVTQVNSFEYYIV